MQRTKDHSRKWSFSPPPPPPPPPLLHTTVLHDSLHPYYHNIFRISTIEGEKTKKPMEVLPSWLPSFLVMTISSFPHPLDLPACLCNLLISCACACTCLLLLLRFFLLVVADKLWPVCCCCCLEHHIEEVSRVQLQSTQRACKSIQDHRDK